MSESIRIGKNGLNPTMLKCYFCGEPTGEIALTGLDGERWAKRNGYPDGEMPRYIVGSIEPCQKCKEKGIAFVEMTSTENGQPTGRRWLVKEEAVRNMIEGKLLENVLLKRMCLITPEISAKIGLMG